MPNLEAALMACFGGSDISGRLPVNIPALDENYQMTDEILYERGEGCLCLQGARKTKRYRRIRVRYQDESFQEHTQDFEGRISQIIQHECDHLEGVVI